MRNESEQGKQGPSHKRSYWMGKGIYDFTLKVLGKLQKEKITGQ